RTQLRGLAAQSTGTQSLLNASNDDITWLSVFLIRGLVKHNIDHFFYPMQDHFKCIDGVSIRDRATPERLTRK
ncbi:MAG: hypothetical protein ABL893_15130, partial [Hyphomicrobium sp.]